MRARIQRDRRRAGVRVVLRARDEALLRALARFRVATTSQLVRLCFADVRRDTAADRLRRLFDGALLDVVACPQHGQNVYEVGPRGRRWLDECRVSVQPAPRGSLEHHLAVVEAWVRLATAIHREPRLRLVQCRADWELRRDGAGTWVDVIPDLAAELAIAGGHDHAAGARVLVEVDLGTERPGILERKLVAHTASIPARGTVVALIAVAAGARRLAALRAIVVRDWPAASVVCSLEEWPMQLLTALGGVTSPPLTASPSSEGRMNGATLDAPTVTPGQGEGLLRE